VHHPGEGRQVRNRKNKGRCGGCRVIDSLADPAVAEAVAATGRRQLITAGIGTEVCGVAPALHAHRDGYQVVFVADACGSATAIGHDISLRRMEQTGITLTRRPIPRGQ
jgi:nicotinamidase-related amidase